jgi:hypothetical protein
MRKLPFLVLAAVAVLPATPANPEPSRGDSLNGPAAAIGQAHSLRSLTLGAYRLGI